MTPTLSASAIVHEIEAADQFPDGDRFCDCGADLAGDELTGEVVHVRRPGRDRSCRRLRQVEPLVAGAARRRWHGRTLVMRAFTVVASQIAACPLRSLLPAHYRNDGSCLCVPETAADGPEDER